MLLGSPDISGGTYVIFEHATRLAAHGIDVTVVTEEPCPPSRLAWHPAASRLRFMHPDEASLEIWDVVLATWWKTVLWMTRLSARRYGYFVQSIESRFYPEDEVPLRHLVEGTYRLGLPVITEARWIRQHLEAMLEVPAALAPNGIRKDLYRPDGSRWAEPPAEGLRVLVEGPLGVPFKNVSRTLELVRRAGVGEMWLMTSTEGASDALADRVFRQVPIDEVGRVYRSCDVLVKLSYVEGMFGPPLEMFHCGGTAMTYDVTGHDEYLVADVNALVLPRDDEEGVVRGLRRLASDRELLAGLRVAARATADAWPDWEASSATFAKAVLNLPGSPSRSVLSAAIDHLHEGYVVAEQLRHRVAHLSRPLWKRGLGRLARTLGR